MPMTFALVLWGLVWGGMFTGDYNFQYIWSLAQPFSFFQGVRAFFPLLALYLALAWIFKEKARFPFFRDPLGFLFLFGFVGVTSSLFLSPDVGQSLYWVGIYVAPLFVMWAIVAGRQSRTLLRLIIYMNYVIFFVLTLALFPEAVRIFRGRANFSAWYNLPFGFGQVTKNGAGRYALIVIIVAGIRFLSGHRRRRLVWFAFLVPSLFLLMQAQSRTALLGLAVVSVLFVMMKGMDWRFILAAPVVGFILWTSGFKLRAQGRLDALVDLSGREVTWSRALVEIGRSPFLGWGFNADRIILEQEHMHNSYLHALIQVGVFGTIFFLAALVSFWLLILKSRLLQTIRERHGEDKIVLMESLLLVGFLTSRSFFESTAAFYGVDLLLLVPAMAYITLAMSYDPADPGEGAETA